MHYSIALVRVSRTDREKYQMFFFFNDTATTEIYTLSLHDALPISCRAYGSGADCIPSDWFSHTVDGLAFAPDGRLFISDRKSTRLNSSHANISYAVFCLKKKKNKLICCCPSRSSFVGLRTRTRCMK